MIKLPFFLILILFTQAVFATKYSGCSDPKYILYVEKRLSFYNKIDKERYLKAQKELSIIPFDQLKKKEHYLYEKHGT